MNARTEAEVAAMSDLRQPPRSDEAEQSVLGALLSWPESLDSVLQHVEAGSFWSHAHRLIFEATTGLLLAGKTADVVSVFQHLRDINRADETGGLAYLNALAQSSAGPGNAKRHAQIVAEKAMQRAIIAAADNAGTIAWADGNTGDKLDRIAALFAGLDRGQMRKAPTAIGQLLVGAIDRYNAMAEGKTVPGWRTGIAPMDRVLGGGLKPGKVYGIAARPSVGKSSAARTIALSTSADGLPTLVLSQEMPGEEVADCIIAELGRIDSQRLQTGQFAYDDWGRIVEAVEQAKALPLYVDDDGGLTIGQIRAKARQIKGLKVLVLDYLQLSSSTLKNATTNDQIAEISKGLKQLALQLGIAVVLLSQLNRDVEKRVDKEPQLSDLRDSGAIEQDLDVAVMLWTVQEPDEGPRLVGWKVAKHRGGKKARFAMNFDAAVYRWSESSVSLAQRKQGGKGFE
jgi:replicative DNA helicase